MSAYDFDNLETLIQIMRDASNAIDPAGVDLPTYAIPTFKHMEQQFYSTLRGWEMLQEVILQREEANND